MRVTDEMVRHWLVWARNFGEVVSYRIGKGKARRFRVRLTPGVTCDGAPFRVKEGLFDITGHAGDDVVPAELMLTAREALVFGYGCAVGRTAALAGARPTWREAWSPAEVEAYGERTEAMRALDREEMEREAVEREEERQRRVADYKRRRDGVGQIEEARS